MSALRLRLQDFALESDARIANARTYSQAEVEAIQRQAFAAGEAEGRAAADAMTSAATAGHAAALHQLTQDAAHLRDEADELLGEALGRLEAIICAALAMATPGSDDLLAALRQAAETVRLPDIAMAASPRTMASLAEAGLTLPANIHSIPDPALGDGEVRLGWAHGGAIAKADAKCAAMQDAVRRALGNCPSAAGVGDAADNPVEGSYSNE